MVQTSGREKGEKQRNKKSNVYALVEENELDE